MHDDINPAGTEEMAKRQECLAGNFSGWLSGIRDALDKECGVDVPCGECNACCKSAYFIHIRPEEKRTLAHIPKKLLFAAPFLPKGNVLLGYDESGRCPMLINDECSIYEYRPLTCRNYDCRIFPAAGISAGDDDKTLINQRIDRWEFSYPAKEDLHQYLAVQAAAKFLREHAASFPAGMVPSNPTQLAILAIQVYDVFLKSENDSRETGSVTSDTDVVKAVMEAKEKFEASGEVRRLSPVPSNR